MEAAVSAYAANSKWCLGLGRRQMSLSIGGGVVVGCCNWSSRKRRINNMNCMKRFRLELTSRGMAAIERRQRLKDKGRFVRGEVASALGGGGGDVEHSDVKLPKASIRITMQQFVGKAVSALGGEVVENGDVILPKASILDAMQQYVVGKVVSKLGGEVVENGGAIFSEASIRVAMQQYLGKAISELGKFVENSNVILPDGSILVAMQQFVGESVSAVGGEVVENGDVILPEASLRVAMEHCVGKVVSELGGEVVENGNVLLPQASVCVAMQQYVGEVVSEFGEVAENGDIIIFPEEYIRVAMQDYIRVPMQYVGPACVGLGGVMFGVGYYLAPKISNNVVVKAVVMLGISIAIMTLVLVKEFGEFKQVREHSRERSDRNRNSGGGGGATTMVPLASVLQHVGLALFTNAMAMFQVGYFLISYTSSSGITSALIALGSMVFLYFLADDTLWVLMKKVSSVKH